METSALEIINPLRQGARLGRQFSIAFLFFLTCCGSVCAGGWVRRAPLFIPDYTDTIPSRSDKSVIIEFEPSVSNAPLNETVWDNVHGPFASPEESVRIGFDQYYLKRYYQIPPLQLMAVAASGVPVTNSVTYIPFGNILCSLFASAARQAFGHVTICFDEQCAQANIAQSSTDDLISVRITSFQVWESPLNHLNLAVVAKASRYHDKTVIHECTFSHQILRVRVGHIFNTHAQIIKRINETTNQFAVEAVRELVKQIF